MEKQEFINHLANHPNAYEWAEGEHDGRPGVYVKSIEFDTVTHFTWAAIHKHEQSILIAQTHHGKNVEQMTRVTGFFSRVSNWNKGKLAELRQRHRVNLQGETV